MYAICRRDRQALDECGDRYGINVRYTDYAEMLADPNVDAVHINSPIADHAPQSIAALKAGKHVASTVPAATTLDECRRIVEAQRKSGKVYMMMETVVYSREYLFVTEMYEKGELGRIQFLRGSHQQDMEGWPCYWEGFPPMRYATHCVSPCLALLGKHSGNRSRDARDRAVVNPLGVKGMGELGTVGILAAIANAVFHATGRRIRELPITPDKLL
jgi:predicted dehydrogenase